jgi:transcriptional regulator with XRE-family HTH domain
MEVNLRRQAEAMAAIDAERKARGMSMSQMAREARLSSNSYSEWLARKRDPSLSKLVQLARVFGFDVVMRRADFETDMQDVPAAINIIAAARKSRQWSLSDMEERSGISLNSFYGWRKCQRDPALSNFVALAETFGFEVVMRGRPP